MTAVRLEGVRKVYEGKESAVAIEGLDLEINAGEFVTLVGPSGCGKTTTLRSIAGLEEITDGRIIIDGDDVTAVAVQDRGVSMVFQNYALFPHMTVYNNIGYGLRVARAPKAERDAKVRKAAETVGITALLDRHPRQLSGGQRQRVAVARALAREPSIILFDEPLSNLDAKLRDVMRAELKALHRRLGNTMIYVTHDQLEALTLSDRIAVMSGGVLQQYGTPWEVYNRPANVFVAGFVGTPTMNLFDARIIAGPNGSQLEMANGQRNDAPDAAIAAGSTEIVVGIRPNDVELSPSRDNTAWTAVVIEPIGSEALIHLEAPNGQKAKALHKEPVPFTEGDRLHLGLPTDRLHVFDAATGTRLGSTTGTAGAGATAVASARGGA